MIKNENIEYNQPTAIDGKLILDRIHQVRKIIGLKLEDLATQSNVSQSSFYRWNENTLPNVNTLSRIAQVLGVSTDYLIGLSDETILKFDGGKFPLSISDVSLARCMMRKEERAKIIKTDFYTMGSESFEK
jgi:transcriptional regulator with XRE-family HTH domain